MNYPQEALALLEVMSGDPWSPGQVQRYTIALRRLEPAIGMAVVSDLCLEKWRPAPADILRAAAARLSPVPVSDEAIVEILHKLRSLGPYGKTDPRNPNIRIPGEPDWSHPSLSMAVNAMGGWQFLCEGGGGEEENPSAFRAQFRDSLKSAGVRWIEAVTAQLMLPHERRDSRYFTAYAPFAVPADFRQEPIIPALTEPKREAAPIPPEVRRIMAPLLDKVTMQPPKPKREDGFDHSAIEAEMAAHRGKHNIPTIEPPDMKIMRFDNLAEEAA